MLTKDDIAAIRKADDICVHLNARNPQGLVRLIKRKSYDPKPFEQDTEHVLPANVAMESWHDNEKIKTGEIKCFAMAGIYHSQCSPVSSILRTIRAGDELRFRFWPDAHSSQYVENIGLHADVLFLDVVRDGKRVARWELETSICPDNTARMCQGARRRSEAA